MLYMPVNMVVFVPMLQQPARAQDPNNQQCIGVPELYADENYCWCDLNLRGSELNGHPTEGNSTTISQQLFTPAGMSQKSTYKNGNKSDKIKFNRFKEYFVNKFKQRVQQLESLAATQGRNALFARRSIKQGFSSLNISSGGNTQANINCRSTKPLKKKKHPERRSQYIGVSKNGSNWQALIVVNKVKLYISNSADEEEAAQTVDFYTLLHQFDKGKLNNDYTVQEALYLLCSMKDDIEKHGKRGTTN